MQKQEQIEYLATWLTGGHYHLFDVSKVQTLCTIQLIEDHYAGIFDIPREATLEPMHLCDEFSRNKIIGLSGFSGSGKDTVADYLVENFGYTKFAFAKPLKMLCGFLFGWTQEQLADGTFKETIDPRHGITPRSALQRIGTDILRNNLTPDLWLRLTLFQNIERIVIPDVRFTNEANAIVELNFPLWRIERTMGEDVMAQPKYRHVSETELIGYQRFTHVIQNDSTLESLYHQVHNLLKK